MGRAGGLNVFHHAILEEKYLLIHRSSLSLL